MRGTPSETSRHARTAALAVSWCVVAIAACGSSSKPPTTTNSSPLAASVRFAACMRAHGVTDYPDPLPGGGFNIPSAINPQSTTFLAAANACGKP